MSLSTPPPSLDFSLQGHSTHPGAANLRADFGSVGTCATRCPGSGLTAPALAARAGRAWLPGSVALSACATLLLGGCNVDSYIDPSTTGRWEETPTIVPILDRIASIEDQPIELVQKSKIQPADLLPEVEEYKFAAADQMSIQIRDFFFVGAVEEFPAFVDLRGYIEIPKLGAVRAQGRTKGELTLEIERLIREKNLNDNPVVNILIGSQRKQTFSILGAVATPGSFVIPAADYRLLEGITTAGGIDETVKSIYVIRQVPLSDAAAGNEPMDAGLSGSGGSGSGAGAGADTRGTPSASGSSSGIDPAATTSGPALIDLIDELAGGETGGKPAPDSPKPTPPSQPSQPAPSQPVAPGVRKGQPPLIDLPGSTFRMAERVTEPVSTEPVSDFVFENGRWVRRMHTPAAAPAAGLLTQRVIEVPVDKLLAGVADVNIVLRPGDVVRVPGNRAGLVYVTGQVNRPGPFNLPGDGSRLTLLRALDSAGGLSSIAIPERVDLTRMVGNDRQATIRINVRAIAEGTQPDLYLKPDDRINVGTNFWAYPLAVTRGGFRMSYGFGFLLDRNFGNDVFGAPPNNNQ